MTELKAQQDKQQEQIDILKKRQDRLDKCTQVVVEHSSELGHCLSFPYPLPAQSAEDWFNLGKDQQKHPLYCQEVVGVNHILAFVSPNKARSTRDPATQQWRRSPSSVWPLESIHSGSSLSYQARKKLSEEGASSIINLFINRTKEEFDRKRSRQEADGKGKGGKGGKGNRGVAAVQ